MLQGKTFVPLVYQYLSNQRPLLSHRMHFCSFVRLDTNSDGDRRSQVSYGMCMKISRDGISLCSQGSDNVPYLVPAESKPHHDILYPF
jgi:hypothetical protein